MKKIFFALILAILALESCTKEDPTAWIDRTSWKFLEKNSEGFKTECNLYLRPNGEVYYYRGFPPSYGYAYDEYRYNIISYTYNGDKSGTIKLKGVSQYNYNEECTADFTLNYNNEKMTINTPHFYATLERTK